MSLQHVKGSVIAFQLSTARSLAWNTATKAAMPAAICRLDLDFVCRIDHEESLEADAKAMCLR